MKTITLLLLAIGFSAAAYAQTPVQKTKSVVFEFSDTWCTPCGAYAVDVADSLEAQMELEDKGYLIGVKTTSQPVSINALGGDSLYANFAADAVPSFIINNASVDEGVTHNNPADVERMLQKVTVFDSIEAVGGIAANLSLTGNTLTVTAKSKFWNATTGDYYMSVMLAEDHISAPQTAYPGNPCIHSNVLRGAMSTIGTALSSSPRGELVGTGMITAGQEFTKTFKCDIDASWVTSNLMAFAIIFKRNADNTYEVVNAEKAVYVATAVGELSNLKDISIYPNPATDIINVAINASEHTMMDARVIDVLGRLVYTQKEITINKGGNNLQIKTGNLQSGNYLITLSNDKMGAITRKVVIE